MRKSRCRKLLIVAALFTFWLLAPIWADAQSRGDVLVNRMDVDGDGKVSKREFRGRSLRFDQVDINGDGFATPEEFNEAIRRARGIGSPQNSPNQNGQSSAKVHDGGDYLLIETRSGGAFKVGLYPADGAHAVILMFEGSGGNFTPGGKGFVSGQYDKFTDAGLTVAILTPPNDRRSFQGGMPPRFRESKAHAKDVEVAVQALKKRFNTPVWLLGISMGSKSVATVLAHRGDKVDGAVFMSSSTRPPGGYKSVAEYDFSRVRAPVLAVAHEDDACKGTPPVGADEIVRQMTTSTAAKVLKFSGGSNRGRSPCGPNTPHTFAGIESDVVSAIADFIQENTR